MKAKKRILTVNPKDVGEYYLLTLLVIGIPVLGWLYVDLKLALALTIIIQVIIGILYFRKGR